jgi:hypothetical protein
MDDNDTRVMVVNRVAGKVVKDRYGGGCVCVYVNTIIQKYDDLFSTGQSMNDELDLDTDDNDGDGKNDDDDDDNADRRSMRSMSFSGGDGEVCFTGMLGCCCCFSEFVCVCRKWEI